MDGKTREEAELTQYLLGEVSEGERARLEEAYFADEGAFEQMLIAEEELIDAYARGELSGAERARFEKVFLASPRGRERVQFARTLADAVSDARPDEAAAAAQAAEVTPPPRPSFFDAFRTRGAALRLAFAASVLVVVAGFLWLFIERARMRDELRRLRDERAALQQGAQELERRVAAEQKRSEDLLTQLEGARAQPGQQKDETAPRELPPRGEAGPRENEPVIARRPPRRPRAPAPDLANTTDAKTGPPETARLVARLPPEGRNAAGIAGSVSYDLKPGLVRGGGGNTLTLPGKATYVLLQLNLDTDPSHENYRAVIETAEGRQVWRADSVKPRRAADAVTVIELPAVPATDLPPSDYVLLLSGKKQGGGFEGVADYSFKVVRK